MNKEENGSNNYEIRRSRKFDITYEALIKKHYRKDTKGKQEFEELVKNYLRDLENNPCSDAVSDEEPFPSNTADQNFKFRKKRWKRLPRLQGAARYGRLLFVVCPPQKIVHLIWIYTHAEFQEPRSRPPDRDLKVELNFVKQQVFSKVEGET